jgi:class 3 adenylate cyclase
MDERPRTRYATNGDIHIAYQVVGDGDIDLLLVDTWVHHVEAVWDFPDYARFMRKLGSVGRLIHFDRRGTGLSDPIPLADLPDLETQVGDAIAVLNAAGSREAVVIGLNDGTIVATLLAASHPEVCRSLVLFTLTASHEVPPDLPLESIEDVIAMITESAGTDDSGVKMLAPSRVDDLEFDEHLSRLQRLSVRPAAFGHYYQQTMEADVTTVLPAITTQTLVINRAGNHIVPSEWSRSAAEAIPGATYVELAGTDHLAFAQGIDELVEEIEEFVTGARTGGDPDRLLATLLFTDIVGSTDKAAEIGDRRWRDMLDQHHELARAQLMRFGGREVSTTGDGFFASFDRPISGVRCALAMIEAIESLGLHIRAGVHTGEVEVRGADLGGLAVHIAARVMSQADPGDVLVSSTVKELLTGSGLMFEDRGQHELKGVPDTWHLYGVTPGS